MSVLSGAPHAAVVAAGLVAATGLIAVAWLAEDAGRSFTSAVLIELAGGVALLVLLDLLLPRLLTLVSARQTRARVAAEFALVEEAMYVALTVRRGAQPSTEPWLGFVAALEKKWGRSLTEAEREAVVQHFVTAVSDATDRVEADSDGDGGRPSGPHPQRPYPA